MNIKRLILPFFILILCCACALAAAEDSGWHCSNCNSDNSAAHYFCPYCGMERPAQLVCFSCGYWASDPAFRFCPMCGVRFGQSAATPTPVIEGLAIDKIATRSGPGTEFTGMGTYKVQDLYLPIISACTDRGGVTWLQCEVTYGGAKRRVYTGIKRFDPFTFKLDQVRSENESGLVGSGVIARRDLDLRYGPGQAYGVCTQEIISDDVDVLALENGWVQVEFVCDDPLWRVWIPESEIIYSHFGK